MRLRLLGFVILVSQLGLAASFAGKPGTRPDGSKSGSRSRGRTGFEKIMVKRTHNRSPGFYVAEDDVGFFMNYTGYTADRGEPPKRIFHGEIGPKTLEMIDAAERCIVFSVFLFDNFYAQQPPPADVVKVLTDLLIQKKKTHPEMVVAVILDPSNKAYGQRISHSEQLFRENGIDVFYSDLVGGLKRSSFFGVREGMAHISRGIDFITLNGWGNLWSAVASQLKAPPAVTFDEERISLETVYNAALLKANHRKLLVTDIRGNGFETLISTANPHNASAFHVNSGISVKGELAEYVYHVLREDIRTSIRLGRRYAHWHYGEDRAYRKSYLTDRLPDRALDLKTPRQPSKDAPVGVTFVSESAIPEAIIEHLQAAGPGDEIRIQMFYLSYKPVLRAVLEAADRTGTPVRLLLDANKDSFNRKKDGTPNRQVARYLLKQTAKPGGRIEVRWYSTHGEQNHVKTMSITNPAAGKNVITTGSCNWTGRNMAGVNMEANVIVTGSRKLNQRFNNYFDRFWTNEGGVEYSLDYDRFPDVRSDLKWILGEKPFYYSSW